MIFTDEWRPIKVSRSATGPHRRIRHSERIYVDGDSHTQTVERVFGPAKNGIRGVYPTVSAKWLQSYLNEDAWRYNRRDGRGEPIFRELLLRSAH